MSAELLREAADAAQANPSLYPPGVAMALAAVLRHQAVMAGHLDVGPRWAELARAVIEAAR